MDFHSWLCSSGSRWGCTRATLRLAGPHLSVCPMSSLLSDIDMDTRPLSSCGCSRGHCKHGHNRFVGRRSRAGIKRATRGCSLCFGGRRAGGRGDGMFVIKITHATIRPITMRQKNKITTLPREGGRKVAGTHRDGGSHIHTQTTRPVRVGGGSIWHMPIPSMPYRTPFTLVGQNPPRHCPSGHSSREPGWAGPRPATS